MWHEKHTQAGAGHRRWRKGVLTLVVVLGLTVLSAACAPLAAPTPSPQTDDTVRPIEDQLQQAFALLPDEIAHQDFTGFAQYFATPDQGADQNGIDEIYTWIQTLRSAGAASGTTATYKLNELHITNVQVKGNDATAHVALDMSKIADGNDPNAAIAVEQDIALVQVERHWLISGADQAKVTNLTQAPR